MSSRLTYSDFRSSVRSGKIEPVYFVASKDNYFLNSASSLMKEALFGHAASDEGYFLKYADECEVDDILELCRNYSSLFTERKLVIVKKCEKYSRKFSDLLDYYRNPDLSTVLILSFDKDFIYERKIDKEMEFFDFSELPQEEYYDWIKSEFNSRGCKIGADEINLFVSEVPMMFDMIEKDIDKISNYDLPLDTSGNRTVTKDIILKFIGYEKEFTPEDLFVSVIKKDSNRANEILDFILNKSGISEVYLLSIINSLYMDILTLKSKGLEGTSSGEMYNKYRLWGERLKFAKQYHKQLDINGLEKVFSILADTDLKLKSTSVDTKVLMSTLVHQLIYS